MSEPRMPTPKEWMDAPHDCREYACWSSIRIEELDADVNRLREMIREFCAQSEYADPAWRAQKHIQPLFDEAGILDNAQTGGDE